jgi:hypothetical protein
MFWMTCCLHLQCKANDTGKGIIDIGRDNKRGVRVWQQIGRGRKVILAVQGEQCSGVLDQLLQVQRSQQGVKSSPIGSRFGWQLSKGIPHGPLRAENAMHRVQSTPKWK